MKTTNIRTLLAAALLTLSATAGAQNLQKLLPKSPRQWASQTHKSPFAKQGNMRRAPQTEPTEIGPANSFGTLYTPGDTEWLYTANYDTDPEKGITGAYITIYDEKHNIIGTIDTEFSLSEHQTSINAVMIDPNVTQKFFNVNDKYEVILFIHATTDDYQGYTYQQVYSLEPDQTEPLLTLPGYEVLVADLSTDKWSEKKQMLMMRDEITDDNNYYIYYDVYDRAGWGSANAPVLLHTFKFDYNYIAGSGGSAMPVTVQNIGGKAHYAVSYYEKPCFDQDTPIYVDPVQTPDNNFIVELYTSDDLAKKGEGEPKPYKSFSIPVEIEEGYLYTFPGIGSLMGNDDFSLGLFGDSNTPYFIVTNDNYEMSTDDFRSSFYLYDQDGNLVKTIAKDVHDYVRVADVEGADITFCFTNDIEQNFRFVALPSCETAANIPYTVDERLLSTSIDRVPEGKGFNYIIAGSNGESDGEGNVLHPIAYFHEDGTLNRWDMVNLGQEVIMAQPAIIAEWLSPYLYNTDNKREYMFLVKMPVGGTSTASEERLWVLNADGHKLLDMGPDKEKGELNTILLSNTNNTNAALQVTYYNWETDEFNLNIQPLPFTMFAGGTGTADDPYLIANSGDLALIAKEPAAHYAVANNIDCLYYPIAGNDCDFSGTLDGRGHTISNLAINGSSLIGRLLGSAQVSDLTLLRPVITPQGSQSGLIAEEARYDGTTAPTVSNVFVIEGTADSDTYAGTFGTLVGQLTTGSTLNASGASDTYINLPNATVGGLVGSVNASGANISAVTFSGAINAQTAGGVVGSMVKAKISNAHVNADITASTTAGGIAGNMGEYSQERGTISHCLTEGTIETTCAPDAALGGIAGSVAAGQNVCITNNFAALDEIIIDGSAKSGAHRIVGHTCADEPGEILWEDPWWDTFEGDPYDHPELWPRAEVLPDAGFSGNHAISPVEPVNGDAQIAADDTSVEGKTVSETGESLKNLFESLGFLFGDDEQNPWTWTGGKAALWFEETALTDIESIQTEQGCIRHTGGLIAADGRIDVFSITGAKVATSVGSVNTSALQPGVYVAKAGKKTMKFVIK